MNNNRCGWNSRHVRLPLNIGDGLPMSVERLNLIHNETGNDFVFCNGSFPLGAEFSSNMKTL
jgi:hypothetical protein